jgi:hypothetical protein
MAMVDQLQNIWLKMRFLEVFSLADLVIFCDEEVPTNYMAGYVLSLIQAGYVIELSGKRNALRRGKGKYRLLRDTGEQAPVLQNGISLLYEGRYIWVKYAIYDPNLDAYFSLIKEEAA